MALIENWTQEQEQLFLYEGNKYFPRLYRKGDKYSISKRLKGYHERDVLLREIRNLKIFEIFDSYGITEYYKSKSSPSVYFSYLGQEYRISNHFSNTFSGIQFIVQWDTNIDEFKLKS